jgi:hypothetical protein
MNSVHLKALQYIQNTAGNARLANFYEDHEPVGLAIWGELRTQGLAYIDSIGIIRLTHDGQAALKSATGSATSRSGTAASSSADNSLDLTNPLNPLSPFSPLNTTFDNSPQTSSDHCSASSHSSSDYGSSSSSSDGSCSYSSDSSSSSSSYD